MNSPSTLKVARSLAGALPAPFWLDQPARPDPRPQLAGDVHCDLAVIGGGYSGLWTALIAMERDPSKDVVLIEAEEAGWAATGRNGGFCAASLTHGLANGLARWPGEIGILQRLGHANLDEIEQTVTRYGIDCGWERTGDLAVATEPHQVAELRKYAQAGAELGEDLTFLDTGEIRAQVQSPTYLAGVRDRHGTAMIDPARLAWGLKQACLDLGVRIFEHTRATRLATHGSGMVVQTRRGRILAARVAQATNAFPALTRRLRPYTIPVYDYALVTEPLTSSQLDSIGWQGREGLSDSGNQFHYYRLTPDNRILWGGFDAIYHYGSRISPDLDQRPATFQALAAHFFQTFPQLEEVRFTHTWGGVIDTCSRYTAFYGTTHRGRTAYAIGFTGLGVGATRFGAQVMIDRLDGQTTERTELEMVRTRPIPFPPEPVRWAGVQLTRVSLARADRNAGRPNLWLKVTDALGMGFNS